MKKFLIAVLFLALSLALIAPLARAETLFGFMDNQFYNKGGELKVYGFMDGKYYNVTGQEVWKNGGEFTLTKPVESGGIISVAPVVGGDLSNNILFPQPVILVPSSTPVIIPLVQSVCKNGNYPSLPAGMVIDKSGNCVPDVSVLPYVSNIAATGTKISLVFNNPLFVMAKVEYSTTPDMANSVMEKQQRDAAGNTIDICTTHNTVGNIYGTDSTSSVVTNLDLSGEGLVSGTTYYFRIKEYQCNVPNVNPWQLYLGETEIYNFITP